MSKKGMDYIEVGGGTESKVIGQSNSISEYMAVVFSLGSYAVQAWLIAFTIVFLLSGFYWLEWKAAAIFSAIFCTAVPAVVFAVSIKLFKKLKEIQEPKEQPRDKNGRFRKARVSVMNRHVGDIYTAEDGETEYVERWGGGG